MLEKRQTAEYILNVLKASGSIFFSWGAQKLMYGTRDGKVYLRFKSNGFKHRGLVYIYYNSETDLMEVELTTLSGKQKTLVTGIYIDQLVEVVDELIETGNMNREQYGKKVDEFIAKTLSSNKD